MVIALFLVIFISLTIILILSKKYKELKDCNLKLNRYLLNFLTTLTSARYGNLNIKVQDGFNDLTNQLSKTANTFLESIYDRDIMLSENIENEKSNQNLKQDFISCLAHDLKVPLIAQDNTFDLFLNGSFGELTEIQEHAIRNLKISNNDLKNLILDLLDARKLEIHKLEPNIERVNLNALISEVIEQNSSILLIKEKKVDFIQNEKIELDIDPVLFKRVLNNLLSNAIFHGKNSKNIEIILQKENEHVEISVIDGGEGLKDDVNDIFKKYYSSQNKYSNVGIGLGLYIANKIVSAHGGKIEAHNIENKGACFKIVL